MRQALFVLGLALFLLGPLHEWSHHHGPGTRESDCIACQFHNAALESPPTIRIPERPLPKATEIPALPVHQASVADPLAVAPKTSPPLPR